MDKEQLKEELMLLATDLLLIETFAQKQPPTQGTIAALRVVGASTPRLCLAGWVYPVLETLGSMGLSEASMAWLNAVIEAAKLHDQEHHDRSQETQQQLSAILQELFFRYFNSQYKEIEEAIDLVDNPDQFYNDINKLAEKISAEWN